MIILLHCDIKIVYLYDIIINTSIVDVLSRDEEVLSLGVACVGCIGVQ